MAKATWAYRLPTPHPARPPVHPFLPDRRTEHAIRPWYAAQMDNYEHLRGGLMMAKAPRAIAATRERELESIKCECAAGRPLWGLDIIQDMYYKEMPPATQHFSAVMDGAVQWDERDTFVDCWRLMERQGVIPNDETICTALRAAGFFGERDMILQIWNRYCTEFRFLEEGEPDPKPVRRVKHTLNRDDLYNLPWWKKQFDFDCNRDLGDHHRFNRTREIYATCAAALTRAGEPALGGALLELLCGQLRDLPTPIAPPMDDPKSKWARTGTDIGLQKKPTRYRIPNVYLFTLRRNTRGIDWIANHEWLMLDHQLGPLNPERSTDIPHGHSRFFSNAQYVLHAHELMIEALQPSEDAMGSVLKLEQDAQKEAEAATEAAELRGEFLGNVGLNFEDLVIAVLSKAADCGAKGADVAQMMSDRCERLQLQPHCCMFQAVLRAHSGECPELDHPDGAIWAATPAAKDVRSGIESTVAALHNSRRLDLQTHTAVLEALVRSRSRTANEYFVKHVLRKFKWNNDQIHLLLREYRDIGEAGDVELQAKLCKRAYLWCQRYNVGLSEAGKQYIEDDYDRIKVQVRTKDELIAWKYRHQFQQREQLKPFLPNPVTDRVTHTLRFGDHQDPEHCEKWAVPYSNAGRSFNWSFAANGPHPPPQAEDVRDLTDIERVKRLPQQCLHSHIAKASDFKRQAGMPYRPELRHEKLHINRWLEEPNKPFPG
eukprot:TRINITY_DN64933_c0_g1_i1.p1 TRINITY_DN64933_c0_g1~~TRINITY_DN64933_c0_g1_i1.p1  ORF type:complete len:715 (+),score=211.24 TRINITY_DN64933_c0_g1_i1:113-2257(+)